MSNNLIVINGFDFGRDKCFGIHRTAMELTRAIDLVLEKEQRNFDVEVAVPTGCRDLNYSSLKVVELKCGNGSKLDKIKWREKVLPGYVEKQSAVCLDTTLALPRHGRCCVFDHDCIVEDHADECYPRLARLRRWHYANRVRRSLEAAEIVFTVSEYSKKKIIQHYGCPEDKVIVVPNAWQHMQRFDQDDRVLEKFGLENREFFFALGSRYPYKNYRWVECAARQNSRYQFVVTGSTIESGEKDASLKPSNLLFTGYLADEEIKSLMAHCKAFLQPSFDEGFGIPPLEAMSVGADCIVSTAAALPEVYGESVRYIDPGKYDNIDMDEILAAPVSGSKQDVLDKYSWMKSAEVVLDAIERLGY